MSGGDSSDGGARPLFRPMGKSALSQVTAARRKSKNRAVEDVVGAALANYSSDEEEAGQSARVRMRVKDALKNLRRSAAQRDDGDRQPRKKRGTGAAEADDEGGDDAAPRFKRARAPARVPLLRDPSEEDERPETVEEAMRFLKMQEKENEENPENGQAPRKQRKGKRELIHKPLNKGGQTQVILEDGTKSSPDKPGDEHTPEKEARLRMKAGGGKGKGKGKNDGGDGLGPESEEEDEGDSKEQLEAWEADLAARVDKKHPDVLATAFSIKPCEPSIIRHLTAASFLGKKRPEEGGHPLLDADGLFNVHFMLGTHKQLQKLREKQLRGDKTSDEVDKADIKYLRWLTIKALKLRVINRRELKQGKPAQERIKKAQKSLRWSLARSSNLAEYSDNEIEDDEISPELKFKGKERPEGFKEITEQNRKAFVTNVASRKTEISVTASHNVDLEEMQDMLTAPSLSFDWEEKGSDDEENLLEVDMPEEESQNTRRAMFGDMLRRSASFHQAKGLTHRDRTKSNLSRSLSSVTLGSAPPAAAEIQRTQSAPERITSDSVSSTSTNANETAATPQSESSQKPATTLWEALESEVSAAPANPGATERTTVEEPSQKKSITAEPSKTLEGASEQEDSIASAASAIQEAPPSEREKVETANASGKSTVPDELKLSEASSLSRKQEELCLQELGMPLQSEPRTLPLEKDIDMASTVEPPSASEAGSTKAAFSETLSQDWGGITPTAMWAADKEDPFGFDSSTGADEKEHNSANTSEGKHLDISPTQPFVQEQEVEISPTMPFCAKVATEQQVEISPTMAFIPKEVPDVQMEISPTMPFEPKAAPKEHVEISPTLPSGAAETVAAQGDSVTAGDGSSATGNTDNKSLPGRSLRRSTSLISEDSLSEPESDDAEAEDENGFRQNPEQRRREREWLRHCAHKRRAARQEAKEQSKSVKRRKSEKPEALGAALLSTQDRSRYQTEIDNNQVGRLQAGSVSGRSEASLSLQGGSMLEEVDVFSSFGGTPSTFQKKKSFLTK